MSLIDRRKLLRSSYGMLAAPLTGVCVLHDISATLQSSVQLPQRPQFSPFLFDYVNSALAQNLGRMRQGEIRGAALMDVARQIKLSAHHIEDVGLDVEFREAAAKASFDAVDPPGTPGLENALRLVQQYDPTIRREELSPRCNASGAEMSSAIESLKVNGLSFHFFNTAEAVKTAAILLNGSIDQSRGTLAPEKSVGSQFAAWVPSRLKSTARIVNAATHRNATTFSCDAHTIVKKKLCDWIRAGGIYWWAAYIVFSRLCQSIWLLEPECVLLSAAGQITSLIGRTLATKLGC